MIAGICFLVHDVAVNDLSLKPSSTRDGYIAIAPVSAIVSS